MRTVRPTPTETATWIPEALLPRFREEMSIRRSDLLDETPVPYPSDEMARRLLAIDAVLDQLPVKPEAFAGSAVNGDTWELQDAAYGLIAFYFAQFSEATGDLWKGCGPSTVGLHAALSMGEEILRLVDSVGLPSRPRWSAES